MDQLALIFTTIMALGVLGAGNAFLIKLFLKPMETKIDNMEKNLSYHIAETKKNIDIDKLEAGQAKLEAGFAELKAIILKNQR